MNNKNITISLFGFSNEGSKELMTRLESELPGFLEERNLAAIINPVIMNGGQYDMLKASMEDDVVIFDGSVELSDGVTSKWDSNYEAANAAAVALDNVLVVSRTPLPMNYRCLSSNVPELGREPLDEDGKKKKYYTNDDIVKWVKSELDNMLNDRRIPVPDKFKMKLPPFDELHTVSETLQPMMEQKYQDAIDFVRKKRVGGAFVSYRTKYYGDVAYHDFFVKDLPNFIRDYHKNPNYPVTIYGPGQVTYEFMTEQRRWNVAKFVDDKIFEVDEVWIYETEDYYDSWWTQAEFISLIYKKSNGMRLPKIIVFRYNSDSNKLEASEVDGCFVPNVSDKTRRELARFYANADGYNENHENMRSIRELDKESQEMFFEYMQGMQGAVLNSPMMSGLLGKNTFESFMESVNSHVYDESFTDCRIAECPVCKNQVHYTRENFNDEFVMRFIHINMYDSRADNESVRERGLFTVTKDEMEKIESNQGCECPYCKTHFRLKKADESDTLFQWWPIRVGRRTGPSGEIIEKVVMWEVV